MANTSASVSKSDWSLHRKGLIDQQRHNEKIKDAIKAMSFTNVMGKTVKFDDHNQAGHWVALHTVLNKKVALADLVEVK